MSTNTNPNPIDLLKDRRRERLDAATKAYWAEVLGIATGKPAGKSLDAAVARVDAAAAALGKAEDQVEADVQALQELAALEPKQVAAGQSRMTARFQAADARIRAAEVALDAAQSALAEANDARQAIGSESAAFGRLQERIQTLRRQLADAGCPDEVAAKF